MTNFNITYATLCNLMDRAYISFKISYPDEEPWWKIQCLRKKKYERPSLSKADTNYQWRKLSIDSENIKSIEEVDLSGYKHTSILKRTTNEQKYHITDIKKTRVGKPCETVEVTTKEQTIDTMDLKLRGDVIDVCMERSQPNTIQHTVIDTKSRILTTEEIITWGKIKSGAWVDVNMETPVDHILKQGRDLLEENTKKQEDDQSHLIQFKNMQAEYEELKISHNNLIIKLNESEGVIETLEKKLKTLTEENQQPVLTNRIVNDTATMTSYKGKYTTLQIKLNKCKQDIMRIMDKYTIIKYSDMIKEHGFILSIPPLIKFFDDDFQEPSPYNSDDDGE